MQTTSYTILAVLMGTIMSIYLPMNSAVSRYIGSPITANISFFLVALFASILIFLVFGNFETVYNVAAVPPYLYLTGFISAFIVLGTTFLIPKIGARKFFILLISGQILMAIVVSHLGALESPKDMITLKKVIGALFVIAGAIISSN